MRANGGANGVDTPTLLVNRDALRRNIEAMQATANGFGVALRPHTKTHKSPEIARMQVQAGARGITVAKLGEAESMADAGIEDILIANQIVGAPKLARLMELARRVRIAVLVDSVAGIEMLGRACAEADLPLDVLIEVDTGKKRCGLRRMDDILALADVVRGTPSLRLRGVETHEGHVAATAEDARDIKARALQAGRRMVEVADALRRHGHTVEEVSVGSTPGAPYTAEVEGITEMRPGTYVFNDVNQMGIGQATPETCALSVLTTVISRPTDGRAVLDAGSKTLFAEPARTRFALPGYDGYGYIKNAPAARITSLSEEHGVVEVPDGVPFPEIGETLEIIPNHVCPCVNLHDAILLVDDGEVVDTLEVAARGRVR